jgi:predicted CXXCH cytochrome family protein
MLLWKPESYRYWLAVSLILAALMLYFYYLYLPARLGPEQPIPFSHRVHAGVKQINCRFCHPFVNRSPKAGLPSLQKCFFCHEYIIPQHSQLLKEKEHFDRKLPVPWIRIFFVPDYVKFRHQPHIAVAKLECIVCHGEVVTMDRLQSRDFQMQFCINCHKKLKAQLDCWLGCHH